MRFVWAFLFVLPVFATDIAIAPQALSFASQYHTFNPVPQGILISTPQSGVFTATRPPENPWLQLPSGTASFSGTTPAFIPINIDASGLTLGTFTSAVTLRFPQGAVTVPVTMTVTAAPILEASPALLAFDASVAFQNVEIGLSNGARFLATPTASVPWLNVQGVTSPLLVTASGGPAGPGLSAGAIQVRSSSALFIANNPLTIPVLYLGNGYSSLGPLTVAPAELTFTPSTPPLQVSITGGAFTASADVNWLTLTPAGQTLTVSANPAGLAPGTYQGTVTLASGGILQMLPVSLTLGPPNLVKLVNAASYAEGAVSPGEVVTLGGVNLGPAALAGATLDGAGALATTVAGVRVLFNGVAAPLIYASAGQVAVVAPYDLDGKTTAAVQVMVNGQASNILNVPVAAAAPGIFTAAASGAGPGAILNGDLSLNSPARPARPGDTVAIYMTGEGQTTPAGVNGKVTVTPAVPRLPVAATIDGQTAEVTFAGSAPAIVSGVMQVNVTVPANARSGELEVVVSVGGIPSQRGVTVSVR